MDDLAVETTPIFAGVFVIIGLLSLPLTIDVAHNQWMCEQRG
jgi:hypothetical protein